jgi:uncharacterized protein involved in exopolysaccharide biosynthesis
MQRWGRVVRRRKWLLLAIVVLIPAAVYGISDQLAKTYRSRATLLLRPTSAGSVIFTRQIGSSASNAEETATLVETTLVAQRGPSAARPDTGGAHQPG